MATRLTNTNPLGSGLEIAATGQFVEFGDEVEVDDKDLAERLIETGNFARSTTKAAKAAAKEGS